jgi:hypothetical protein
LTRVRPLLSLAAVLALAIVLSACGSSSGGSSDESPKDVLKGASFEGIESGDLDLRLKVDSTGKEGGNADVAITGPFQTGAKGKLPEVQMNAEVKYDAEGNSGEKEFGFTLLPEKAFIAYEGTDYEVDPSTFSIAESAIKQAEQEGGGEEETTACQEAATELKPEEFVDGLKNEGGEDVGGTETTKVSGDLDTSSAIAAITKLIENPACSSQLEQAGPLPLGELDKAKGEIESAVKTAHADIYVGEDKIIRRVTADLVVEPEGSGESVHVELDLTIDGVNEDQEITAPSNAKPLEGLYEELGVNPLELLGAVQGGGLGSLLEGATGGAAIPPSLGGEGSGSSGGSGGGGGAQKEYLECVQGANGATELQKCVEDLQ